MADSEKPAAIALKAAARQMGITYELAWDTARRNRELMPGVTPFRVGGRWYIARAPFERALGIGDD